jgi:o-succinylbenzoate synthase
MQVDPFSVRLDPPLESARGRIGEREGFLVRLTAGGSEGLGEATPLAGWTESREECRAALNRAQTVAEELDWGIALAKLDAPAARHGLALALAEARARASGEPLYRSLGGSRPVESVPVNATLGADGTPAETARRAREAVDAGYDCLKVKVGTTGVEEDIERVRAVRDAVGDGVTLRVDANAAWTEREAQRALEAMAALEVAYVEQPLPTAKLRETMQLTDSVDIALDESLAAHDVETIIETGAADVLVLKPMVLGGPDLAASAARQCRAADIEPVVSTTVDAVVARTAAVHVAASVPDAAPCGLATGDRIARDLAADPAPVLGGEMVVPQGNGLGLRERP